MSEALEPKHRGPAPRHTDDRRSCVKRVRLYPAEVEAWETAAEAQGLSLSDFVRQCVTLALGESNQV